MKRLLLLVLCLPIVCLGQGVRYDSHVITSASNVPYGAQAPIYTIPFSSVYICAYPASGNPCTNTVNVYSDQALTQVVSQPLQSDDQGRFGFWASSGQYSYSVVSPGGKFLGTYTLTLGGTGGGGASPAGSPTEIQTNLNNTALGGSKIFSDGSTYAYTPIPQWAQYSRNSQKSNYCGNQCANIAIYGQDTPPLNDSGNATGFGQVFYKHRSGLFTSLGQFDGYSGDPNDPGGGTVLKLLNSRAVFHTPSISQDESKWTVCGKPGDCAGLYSYLWSHGGYAYGSDEGSTNIKAGGGLSYQHQAAFQVSGSPTAGATTVSASQVWNYDDMFVGGFVYDYNSSPIASGNITAYDANTHLLTVTAGSVTPSTTAGTTNGAITITTPDAVNGVSLTVTVNVTQGSGFTISQSNPLVFACSNPEIEFVVPTAVGTVDASGNQTITANFMHGHSAGCKVAQGGTMGVLDLVADRIGNNWKTSYFVFAAPDNSHIYEVTYLQGARGAINLWKHNFGPGYNSLMAVSNAQITGDGTTITACNLGQAGFSFGGQYVQITGSTPSSFNGTYTASALNQNLCVTMSGTGTGTATGATISVGGAINSPDGTTQGPGGFKIWATARLRQVGTSATTTNGVTTNSYNNTFYFYPNSFTFVNGDVIQVLDDMQAKVEPLSDVGIYDVAPNNKVNGWLTVSAEGYGVTNPLEFRMVRIINGNPADWYQGGGGTGQLQAPRGISLEGMFTQGVYMDQPVTGGFGIYMETTSKTSNTGINNAFFPLVVAGAGGGGGGLTINYDPNAGKTIITSGTGNGVYTSITMDPTNFSMGAGSTGTFTLTGQTFKFDKFTAPSTTCASLDPTGVLGRVCPAFGASGASHASGLVPDPGSTAGTTKVLFEDGTWKLPTTGFTGTCASTTTLTVSNGVITGCS